MMLDTQRLIAWLKSKAATRSPLVGAVYQGLAERLERGEFDMEGDD